MGSKSFVFRFDDVEVREREFSLVKADQALTVEPKAFRVLLFLLRNPQRLVSKEELLNAVWGDVAVSEGSLTRCIWMLRNALGDDTRGTRSRYIETVPTVGYRFICKVEASEDASVEREAAGKPNHVGSVETKVGSRKEVGRWVLTGCVMLALCGAAAFWYLHSSQPPLRVTGTNPIAHGEYVTWIAGTDGARIYFKYDPPTEAVSSAVSMVSISGGEIQKLPLGVGPVFLWDVSADGSNLLVSSLEPSALWTVSVPGGPAHFIAKVENSWSFRWSPDGKYIAYTAEREGQRGLYVMGRDGADVHKLVTLKAIDDFPEPLAWSPDGGRIRFTDHHSLWEVSPTGTNLHLVFPKWKGPAGQCCGHWTPDGDFYLFIAGVPDAEQIWALDERHRFLLSASPDPVPLTSGPIHWASPTPSKDGNKIFAKGTMYRGELVRFDQTSKQLRPFLDGISAEFVTYSKNGAQIAYVTFPDGILWRAKADGTERIQLTNPPLFPIVCRWSPDGSQILFTAARDPSLIPPRYALYVIPAQGGTPRLLPSDNEGQAQGDGVWSPDGRRVMYGLWPKNSLRILDLDSGKVSEVPGSNGLGSPRWSPNGRYVAALTTLGDAVRIFDLQTQQWSTLVEHRGNWGFPTWSHDSKFLYALNFPAVNGAVPPSVYRIAVPGGTPQRVVDLRDVPLTGAVNFWFGLDPDDTPLLLRDNGSNNIYALTLDKK